MTSSSEQFLLIENSSSKEGVSNNRDAHSVICDWLRQAGYLIYQVGSLRQGLVLLTQQAISVVLCDLNSLDEESGDILLAIKTEFSDVPVIVMSATGVMSDVVSALRQGAADYLMLPIENTQVLELAINRSLKQGRLQRENIAYRQQLEQANSDLQQNLEVLEQDQLAGRQVQLKMLPSSPQQFADLSFSHRIVPSFYLSGDFVDYFSVGDDYVVFFIADVSGHGASSAFLTVLLKNMFARKRSDYLHRDDATILSPAAMLYVANRNLLNTGIGKHATLCVGVIDLRTDSLRYSVAGHLPLPIMATGDDCRYLVGEGMPVGLFEQAEYTENELLLPKSFVLTLFSDGILEVISAAGVIAQEQYLLDHLSTAPDHINAIVSALSLQDIKTGPDDIAVLLISRSGVVDTSNE
ncbi:MAG: serine phosphatase RsbU (regulator of sigma subunit) [Oceanicoccus sp.]|jgi:serine phosphatase RsbU (regulator of sigma subunit)